MSSKEDILDQLDSEIIGTGNILYSESEIPLNQVRTQSLENQIIIMKALEKILEHVEVKDD